VAQEEKLSQDLQKILSALQSYSATSGASISSASSSVMLAA